MTKIKSCGFCAHWSHEMKRNISVSERPIYYSDCNYPIDETALPHCMAIEQTSEHNGMNCPCFVWIEETK